jgi:serine/threonine protein kinase
MEKYPRFLHEFEGYKLGKTIDKGSMGKVKIATTSDGVQYACKIIKRPVVDSGEEYLKKYTFMEDLRDKYSNTTDDMDDIRLVREMATALLLDHPYIVTVHAAFVSNYYYYVLMDVIID